MQALVVYESMFGNTEALARAVGEGIAGWALTTVVAVTAAPTVVGPDVDLLVVGGPTHALGLSRPTTRANAVEQGAQPVTPVNRGLREWLGDVKFAGETAIATFDTRVGRVPGSAAKAALRRLRRRGGIVAAPAASFSVAGTPGPVIDGELERARDWGASLAAVVTSHGARS
jgi:flavodoxin